MNDKRFFVLNPDCFLVKGALRGAIYDLKSGNVFSADEWSIKALELLARGENIENVIKEVDLSENRLTTYLLKLEELGLGKHREYYIKRESNVPELSSVLRYVLHLELTTDCNLRCVHCYNESEISKANLEKEPSLSHWENTIRDAYEMGCRRIQFIGGEPFLRRQLVFKLIFLACEVGYKSLEVSSNGTLMFDSDFKFLKNHNVDLALSFYSHQPKIHDVITAKDGSWQKTLRGIKKALEIGVYLRIAVVVMEQNEQDIDETVGLLKFLGVKDVKSTAVEPAGRGCNENLITADICKKQVRSKPHFSKISQNIFWRNRTGHNCFLEQICIGSDGAVYPCLAERKISYGNIKFNSLTKILSSKTAEKFRHLSKDYIEVCWDCEYRYCCFDCRVRTKDFLDKDSHSKPWWCLYNPYSGSWSKKQKERR